VTVYSDRLEDYAWVENIGWIHFEVDTYGVTR